MPITFIDTIDDSVLTPSLYHVSQRSWIMYYYKLHMVTHLDSPRDFLLFLYLLEGRGVIKVFTIIITKPVQSTSKAPFWG